MLSATGVTGRSGARERAVVRGAEPVEHRGEQRGGVLGDELLGGPLLGGQQLGGDVRQLLGNRSAARAVDSRAGIARASSGSEVPAVLTRGGLSGFGDDRPGGVAFDGLRGGCRPGGFRFDGLRGSDDRGLNRLPRGRFRTGSRSGAPAVLVASSATEQRRKESSTRFGLSPALFIVGRLCGELAAVLQWCGVGSDSTRLVPRSAGVPRYGYLLLPRASTSARRTACGSASRPAPLLRSALPATAVESCVGWPSRSRRRSGWRHSAHRSVGGGSSRMTVSLTFVPQPDGLI